MRGTLPLVIVVGCLALLLGRCTVKMPEPEYKTILVSRPVYLASKPDTVVRWKDRIVTRVVQAEQVAISPKADSDVVQKFCVPTIKTDTLYDSVPAKPIPMLFDAGTYDGKKLKLWEVRANGDGALETFNAHAPLSFAVKDGRALVKSSRFWWVKPLARDVFFVGVGYVGGKIK